MIVASMLYCSTLIDLYIRVLSSIFKSILRFCHASHWFVGYKSGHTKRSPDDSMEIISEVQKCFLEDRTLFFEVMM